MFIFYTTNFKQDFFVEQNFIELEKYQVLKVSICHEPPATDFLPFHMPSKIAGEFLEITMASNRTRTRSVNTNQLLFFEPEPELNPKT